DKCGYGPRIPILVISQYAKVNFTDHNLTDFASIIKFIEDNWKLGQIGNGSFDSIANSLSNMFNWSKKIS
ncbi:MAG TPA: alkaline phosphatase family protein, partial [Candidatus Nitrosocosmicus sp.]